jgi:hypothetical protein
MTISESVKKILRRIFRITITTVLVLLGIILLILLLIQTGPVQNYGRGKLEAYLENKLQTKVRIGNLYIDFPYPHHSEKRLSGRPAKRHFALRW